MRDQNKGFQHYEVIPDHFAMLFPHCGGHEFHMFNVGEPLLLVSLDKDYVVHAKEIRHPNTHGKLIGNGNGKHILELHPKYDQHIVVGEPLDLRKEKRKAQLDEDFPRALNFPEGVVVRFIDQANHEKFGEGPVVAHEGHIVAFIPRKGDGRRCHVQENRLVEMPERVGQKAKPHGWFGVIDHHGAVKAHPWNLGDDYTKINHTAIFGFGAGIRWRVNSAGLFWYQEPTDDEKFAVESFLEKKGMGGIPSAFASGGRSAQKDNDEDFPGGGFGKGALVKSKLTGNTGIVQEVLADDSGRMGPKLALVELESGYTWIYLKDLEELKDHELRIAASDLRYDGEVEMLGRKLHQYSIPSEPYDITFTVKAEASKEEIQEAANAAQARFRKADLEEDVALLVGEASMLWEHPEKAGVFQSDRGSELVDEFLDKHPEKLALRLSQLDEEFPTGGFAVGDLVLVDGRESGEVAAVDRDYTYHHNYLVDLPSGFEWCHIDRLKSYKDPEKRTLRLSQSDEEFPIDPRAPEPKFNQWGHLRFFDFPENYNYGALRRSADPALIETVLHRMQYTCKITEIQTKDDGFAYSERIKEYFNGILPEVVFSPAVHAPNGTYILREQTTLELARSAIAKKLLELKVTPPKLLDHLYPRAQRSAQLKSESKAWMTPDGTLEFLDLQDRHAWSAEQKLGYAKNSINTDDIVDALLSRGFLRIVIADFRILVDGKPSPKQLSALKDYAIEHSMIVADALHGAVLFEPAERSGRRIRLSQQDEEFPNEIPFPIGSKAYFISKYGIVDLYGNPRQGWAVIIDILGRGARGIKLESGALYRVKVNELHNTEPRLGQKEEAFPDDPNGFVVLNNGTVPPTYLSDLQGNNSTNRLLAVYLFLDLESAEKACKNAGANWEVKPFNRTRFLHILGRTAQKEEEFPDRSGIFVLKDSGTHGGKWYVKDNIGSLRMCPTREEAKKFRSRQEAETYIGGTLEERNLKLIPIDSREAQRIKHKRIASHAVDLDGTLAHYEKGKFDPEVIGLPIPKMLDRVKQWLADGDEVVIFTARASDPDNIPPIEAWLDEHGLADCKISNEKTPEMEDFWDDKAIAIKPNTGKPIKRVGQKDPMDYLRQRLLRSDENGDIQIVFNVPADALEEDANTVEKEDGPEEAGGLRDMAKNKRSWDNAKTPQELVETVSQGVGGSKDEWLAEFQDILGELDSDWMPVDKRTAQTDDEKAAAIWDLLKPTERRKYLTNIPQPGISDRCSWDQLNTFTKRWLSKSLRRLGNPSNRARLSQFQSEKIAKVAVKCDGHIISGGRSHAECVRYAEDQGINPQTEREDGFLTTTERFVSRKKGYDIAEANNQLEGNFEDRLLHSYAVRKAELVIGLRIAQDSDFPAEIPFPVGSQAMWGGDLVTIMEIADRNARRVKVPREHHFYFVSIKDLKPLEERVAQSEDEFPVGSYYYLMDSHPGAYAPFCGKSGNEVAQLDRAYKFRTQQEAKEYAEGHPGWEIPENCRIVSLPEAEAFLEHNSRQGQSDAEFPNEAPFVIEDQWSNRLLDLDGNFDTFELERAKRFTTMEAAQEVSNELRKRGTNTAIWQLQPHHTGGLILQVPSQRGIRLSQSDRRFPSDPEGWILRYKDRDPAREPRYLKYYKEKPENSCGYTSLRNATFFRTEADAIEAGKILDSVWPYGHPKLQKVKGLGATLKLVQGQKDEEFPGSATYFGIFSSHPNGGFMKPGFRYTDFSRDALAFRTKEEAEEALKFIYETVENIPRFIRVVELPDIGTRSTRLAQAESEFPLDPPSLVGNSTNGWLTSNIFGSCTKYIEESENHGQTNDFRYGKILCKYDAKIGGHKFYLDLEGERHGASQIRLAQSDTEFPNPPSNTWRLLDCNSPISLEHGWEGDVWVNYSKVIPVFITHYSDNYGDIFTIRVADGSRWTYKDFASLEQAIEFVNKTVARKGQSNSIRLSAFYNPNEKEPLKQRLGRCYELAGRLASNNDHATLIHGSIQGFGNPRIDHAWVEINGQIWEPCTNKLWEPQVFNVVWNPIENQRFSSEQVNIHILKEEHWGPWDGTVPSKRDGQVESDFPTPTQFYVLKSKGHCAASYGAVYASSLGQTEDPTDPIFHCTSDIEKAQRFSKFAAQQVIDSLGASGWEVVPYTQVGKRDGQSDEEFPTEPEWWGIINEDGWFLDCNHFSVDRPSKAMRFRDRESAYEYNRRMCSRPHGGPAYTVAKLPRNINLGGIRLSSQQEDSEFRSDNEDQMQWLASKAKELGYDRVNELVIHDQPAFISLAREWRKDHPRGIRLSQLDTDFPIGNYWLIASPEDQVRGSRVYVSKDQPNDMGTYRKERAMLFRSYEEARKFIEDHNLQEDWIYGKPAIRKAQKEFPNYWIICDEDANRRMYLRDESGFTHQAENARKFHNKQEADNFLENIKFRWPYLGEPQVREAQKDDEFPSDPKYLPGARVILHNNTPATIVEMPQWAIDQRSKWPDPSSGEEEIAVRYDGSNNIVVTDKKFIVDRIKDRAYRNAQSDGEFPSDHYYLIAHPESKPSEAFYCEDKPHPLGGYSFKYWGVEPINVVRFRSEQEALKEIAQNAVTRLYGDPEIRKAQRITGRDQALLNEVHNLVKTHIGDVVYCAKAVFAFLSGIRGVTDRLSLPLAQLFDMIGPFSEKSAPDFLNEVPDHAWAQIRQDLKAGFGASWENTADWDRSFSIGFSLRNQEDADNIAKRNLGI